MRMRSVGILGGIVAAVAVVALAAGSSWADAPAPKATGPAVPVVVELFSSEGCSSCPPADKFLDELERTQPVDGVSIIALGEHVDYWDDLGWPDRFASPRFTARQKQYAGVLEDSRTYTPELVIDGRTILDRGDRASTARALQAAAREPRARVTLNRRGDRVAVDVANVPAGNDTAEVWLAITESGLSTNVQRGENAGRVLAHAPVVRALRKLGNAEGGAFRGDAALELDPKWKASALHTVVFVQRAKSRRIVGAAQI
ncbi:DUF1223 domain-containing protein [Pendulispora brunnea]|uniref:DUF1223 domain-containing protein n=1 Tax=Pendulispora brunnea TaxID=2905690 RepID=A0ABZ2K9B4_9BACT